MPNVLGLTEPVDVSVRPYYDRPYRVIDAGRFAASLRESVSAAEIRRLRPTGAVDQFVDSTDALGDRQLLRAAISGRLRTLALAAGERTEAAGWSVGHATI